MSVNSQPVPNLIQGVSQQSPSQRRDSQCEAQFDCINSPVNGAISRPASEFLKLYASEDFTQAFFYEIIRGTSEHYLVVIKGGNLRAFDLADGTECTVTFTANKNYLTLPSGIPRDSFAAQTVNDTTFFANKTKVTAMASTTKALRPKEALAYWRGTGYLITFQLSITYNNKVYTWTYKTPDNSTAGNANYIGTNQLAATFYRALTGAAAPVTTSGDALTANNNGVGASWAGDNGGGGGSGTVTAPITATSLGFSVAINGNVLRIWRTDGVDFTIDSSDGQGNTYLKVFKDSAQAFSDLPNTGFDGFTLKVQGASKTTDDDYYVAFQGTSASYGFWGETSAPGVHTGFDYTTMPHILVNTGYRAFEWKQAPWGGRVVGDEVMDGSKNPSFIGKVLQDVFYYQSRLGLMTESSCVWSKTRNVYVFFPDTMQTVLATAPIDDDIAAADYIALLRRAVNIDEGLFLWAQRQQLRVSSGQDPFKQDTIEVLPSTAYEFAESPDPLRLGLNLYFATELGGWASILNLPFANGKPQGDIDVTAHVPSYIAAGVHRLIGSLPLKMALVLSDGSPSSVYIYNFLTDQEQIVQSAWNTWRIPCTSVLWMSIYRSTLYMMIQRASGVALLTVNLQANAVDPGGAYQTRMDLRVSEAQCAVTYNAATRQSAITLPYACPEAAADSSKMLVVTRSDGAAYTRGRLFNVLGVTGAVVTVDGDIRGYNFYAGLRISAERLESEFHLRSGNGPIPYDELGVRTYRATHAKTGYYRIEVTYPDGRLKMEEWSGRVLGSASSSTGTPVPSNGQLDVGVDAKNDEAAVRLINDSFLPSAWQTATWTYESVLRAPVPRGYGQNQG